MSNILTEIISFCILLVAPLSAQCLLYIVECFYPFCMAVLKSIFDFSLRKGILKYIGKFFLLRQYINYRIPLLVQGRANKKPSRFRQTALKVKGNT